MLKHNFKTPKDMSNQYREESWLSYPRLGSLVNLNNTQIWPNSINESKWALGEFDRIDTAWSWPVTCKHKLEPTSLKDYKAYICNKVIVVT